MLNRLSFMTILLLIVSVSQSETLKEQIESDNRMSVFAGCFVSTCLLIVGFVSAFLSWNTQRISKTNKSSGNNLFQKSPEKMYKNLRVKILKEASKYFKMSRKNVEPFSNDIKNDLDREIHNQISYWVLYESARLSHRLEELSDRMQELEKSSSPEIENIQKEADEISRELAIFKEHFSDKDRLLNG